ncbi:hypothetical protein LPMP_030410 [Leishmania panamensis]|uniref:Uncharacterized protein n=1 Tax=Leishmania panamensis TaxID=5679 RepID=A0A088S1C6_LEIPA|nr:hypothetical protein LPMP_030410 [Leishmania panamensis]AIN95276.1 hypothetical protein LPMP_030410 [Leishmania panamensis]
MQTPTAASWQRQQQQQQQQRGTDLAFSLSPQQRPSPSLMSPPSAPRQHGGGRHQHGHRHQYQRLPRASVPAPPPYSDFSGVASAGESVSPLLWSSEMPSPPRSPLQHQQPYHRRYRSSLPAPPPLRILTLSSDHSSLRRTRANAPRQQQQQQRAHYVDSSARPAVGRAPPLSIAALEEHGAAEATARRGSRIHHRRSTRGRSNVQPHPSAMVLSKDQEEETLPSTPVNQRIPAMVVPSYDVCNLNLSGAGESGPAAAAAAVVVGGTYRSSSLTSQVYQLKTAQPQPQLLQKLKLVDGVWRGVVPPQQQQQPPTSGQPMQRGTADHPYHDQVACHSFNSHCGGCERCLEGVADGAHVEGSSMGIHGESALAKAPASPTRCHLAKSPTYRTPAMTTTTAAGTSCDPSMSALGGDWRSPSLAAANMWCHHQHYPQLYHARTTPASVAMRSSSVGLSDGLDMALSPISTPARAPRTPRQLQLDLHRVHYYHHAHSLSVPSLASEGPYTTYGQCSTPREADLAADTPLSTAPGAAASVAGRSYHQPLVTPTIVIARATPAAARDALIASTSIGAPLLHNNARTMPSSIAFDLASATAAARNLRAGSGVDVVTRRGGAIADHDNDDDGAALLRASSSAHLRYRRNADFLYAVDSADECETTAVPMTNAATAEGNAFMLAAAQATATMDSPVTLSHFVSSSSSAPSSEYCSPQQLRVGDAQQRAPGTATPARTAALRTYQPQNSAPYDRHGAHAASQPPHVGSGGILHRCATLTPLRSLRHDAVRWEGAKLLTTPPSATCCAASTGEGWRSPMLWDPRQARDDLEMEAVKHVARFALAQVAATAAAAGPAAATIWSSVSPSPAYATAPFDTVAQATVVAISPSHARDASRPEETRDYSVSQDTVAVEGEEEEAAEWLELLLHYRDRENESGRIRRALVDAAPAPQVPTAETEGASNPSAVAAATLSWWATSSLMREGLPSRGNGGALQQPQGRQLHHARTPSAVSSPSTGTATRAALAPPPSQLCAVMTAHRAARTIARCVHYHVWRMREGERRRVSASVAARLSRHASQRAA